MVDNIINNPEEGEEHSYSYDYFYYDYSILSKLLDLKQVEQFLVQNNIDFKDYWKAHLYFIELSMTDLYSRIEAFINDYSISRFLKNYDDDFPAYIIENYLGKDPFISRIYAFEQIRKSLANLRLKKDFTADAITHELKGLQTALDETNTFISKEYEVKRKNPDPTPINFPILNYLTSIYGYVQHQSLPLAPFFQTLPRANILGQYVEKKLTTPKQYFQGYALFFFYLCSCFGGTLSINIKDTTCNLKDLRELHQISSVVHRENIRGNNDTATYRPLFSENDKPVKMIKHVNRVVKNYEQLEFLLGNSDVKVIDPYEFFGKPLIFSGGETKTDDLLLTILYGELARLKRGEKLEIIRFSHYIKKKMGATWYSYAFYMRPAYWLVFDGVGYDTWRLRYTLEYILKDNKDAIEYTALKVKDELLRQYYKKKDRDIRFENYEKGVDGNIKGLLTELATVVYLLKVRNASITGIRTNAVDTDIDVEAKNSLSTFMVQAKNSMPIKKSALKREIREINAHFKKLDKYRSGGDKPIKILFFIGWRYPVGAEEPEVLIQKRKLYLSAELMKKDIICASYAELDFILKYKKENNLNGIMKKVLGFDDGFVFG